MDNKKIRLQRAAIFAFFISINIFLLGFFGVPKIQALSEMSKASEENISLKNQLEADNLSAKALEKKIGGYEEKISGFSEVVPDNLDTAQLVYDFYVFSAIKGIAPIHIAFDEAAEKAKDDKVSVPKSEAARISITFIAEGLAKDIISFIEDAEKITGQNIQVDSIRLQDAGEGMVQAEIGLTTYVRNTLPPDSRYSDYEFHLENIGHEDIGAMFGD
ncbi:hypothetical protein [Youngiibacter multivorans]|uniref:Uncharacterized protein n=1 Tax=Youngiibacter multivorans TaxID=937251 RepID=A0ABS4G7N6_9CLOT|nr:hypothetical protein [Youngiibacter multivorans]MBP1920566.1 hypothetical protein [Youngiibacter multivorans]